MDASIIIPCKNEGGNLKKTVDSIMSSKNQKSFEIIIVDDGTIYENYDFINKSSYDNVKIIRSGNLGAAKARNLGAKLAYGQYLFFCDAHISVPNYWIDNLIEALEKNNSHIVAPVIKDMKKEEYKGYGQTWNKELQVQWLLDKPEDNFTVIPIACGCCFGIRKNVFKEIGGFDKYFEVWGKEDEELSLKAWLFGYKIVLDTRIEVKHLFRSKHPYEVTYENFIYNFLCMIYSHFSDKHLSKALNIACNHYAFSKAASKFILNENLLKQREEYFNKRKYNENYFFQKFNILF